VHLSSASSLHMASSAHPTIMFWNSRGLRRHLISGALESLVNPTLNPHPPSIVVLAETHWSAVLPYHRTSTTQLPNIPHYSWAHRHHTHRSGGLVILYHNSIACIPMSILDQQCNPINAVDPASASAVMWHLMTTMDQQQPEPWVKPSPMHSQCHSL
jgi:hypothetical protein